MLTLFQETDAMRYREIVARTHVRLQGPPPDAAQRIVRGTGAYILLDIPRGRGDG